MPDPNQFNFDTALVNAAREAERLRQRETAESVFRHIGAGAEVLRTGTDMATALDKRPMSGETMTRKEKLDRLQSIVPLYGGKESQQQQLGYTAINDQLTRELDASKAAMDLRATLASIETQGSIATLQFQNNAEDRRIRAAEFNLAQAQTPSAAAQRATSGVAQVLDRYSNGKLGAATDEAYNAKILNLLETGMDPESISPSMSAELRKEAQREAGAKVNAFFYSQSPADRQGMVRELAGAFQGENYANLSDYDKVHLARETAGLLGLGAGELQNEFARFAPDAAENVRQAQTIVAERVQHNTKLIESDNYLRSQTASGVDSAGASTQAAKDAANALLTRTLRDPAGMNALAPDIRAALTGTANEMYGGIDKASKALNVGPWAEVSTPVVPVTPPPAAADVGARVGQQVASSMGAPAAPAVGPIAQTTQAIQKEQEQAQAAQAQEQAAGPTFIGIPVGEISQRIPDFQVPSDAVGQFRAMIDVVHAFPEHSAATEAKMAIQKSPKYLEYVEKRGYGGDPEFAWSEYLRETKLLARTQKAEARAAHQRNVARGLVQARGGMDLRAAGRQVSTPDAAKARLAGAASDVPEAAPVKDPAEAARQQAIAEARGALNKSLQAQRTAEDDAAEAAAEKLAGLPPKR